MRRCRSMDVLLESCRRAVKTRPTKMVVKSATEDGSGTAAVCNEMVTSPLPVCEPAVNVGEVNAASM